MWKSQNRTSHSCFYNHKLRELYKNVHTCRIHYFSSSLFSFSPLRLWCRAFRSSCIYWGWVLPHNSHIPDFAWVYLSPDWVPAVTSTLFLRTYRVGKRRMEVVVNLGKKTVLLNFTECAVLRWDCNASQEPILAANRIKQAIFCRKELTNGKPTILLNRIYYCTKVT